MLLLCLSFPIFASFLFLHVDSQPYDGDFGTISCDQNPCADGYTCAIKNQKPYCYYREQSSIADQTFNINSNNRFIDREFFNFILRLIRLLGNVLYKNNSVDNKIAQSSKSQDQEQTDKSSKWEDQEKTDKSSKWGDQEQTDKSSKWEDQEQTDKGPCSPNPCEFGGKCTADPTTNATACECPFPTGGDKCEKDLGACQHCARLGQLVLFLLNDTPMNWQGAKDECANRSLIMYAPKTPDTSKFGRDYMLQQESDNQTPTPHTVYWIGGKREAPDQSFVWTDDNSIVGESTDWLLNSPTSDDSNCMELSGNDYAYRWGNYRCGEIDSGYWKYYPACTGTYDFFSN